MEQLRVAVIGAGNIADCHLGAYRQVKGAKVVALCDINPDRLKETGDKYGIDKRYLSVDEMLADMKGELDAADVCVWNVNHAECAIKALNAGLHVFCEKPMAYNTEQAVAMKEAAEKNGRLLMLGFVTRFHTDGKIAKDFIDNGYLGEIYYSKATYVRRHGNPGGWFGDKSRSGGGPVIDLGVHVIDFTRYMMGKPKPVSVYASVQYKLGNRAYLKNTPGWIPRDAKPDDPADVEDFATALIRYDNGAVTLLETSYDINGAGEGSRKLYGTKAGMDLTGGKVKLFTTYNDYIADVDIQTDAYKGAVANGFTEELKHFVDCVVNGTECTATAEDGVIVMKILDAIYESGRTGHEVIIR